jgi:hypothetical protein
VKIKNFDEADILTMTELKQAYVTIKAKSECTNLNDIKKFCAGDSVPFRRSKRQLNEIHPCHVRAFFLLIIHKFESINIRNCTGR